jgi:hypothetical protein
MTVRIDHGGASGGLITKGRAPRRAEFDAFG